MTRSSKHTGAARQSAARNTAAAFCLVCTFLLFTGPLSTAVAREVPDYQGYVNDYAAMMSPGTRTKLERALQSFDLSDSTQMAILTINSLEGDPLEDFSIRVVDKWKVGQEDKDNGVLFLVVKDDRKMRIEVGRGLEHVLTDLAAGRIIDRIVTPLFKDSRFDEGFEAATAAIIQTTRGEYSPEAGTRRGTSTSGAPPFFKLLLFGMLFIIVLAYNSRKLGVIGGCIIFPLIFFLGLPVVALTLLLVLSVVGAFIGLALSFLFSVTAMPGGSTGSRGGYYMGGGRIGGFGGGFGGGGFGGFGGGGFGGGGASGGW